MVPNNLINNTNKLNSANYLDDVKMDLIENNVEEEKNPDIILNYNVINSEKKINTENQKSDNLVQENIPINFETSSFNKSETVETNCLALTVRKDYSLAIFKNSIFTSIRMSIKVAILTIILNVLKLFF